MASDMDWQTPEDAVPSAFVTAATSPREPFGLSTYRSSTCSDASISSPSASGAVHAPSWCLTGIVRMSPTARLGSQGEPACSTRSSTSRRVADAVTRTGTRVGG